MRKVNALQLRQSLSKIINLLNKNGEPVLLEKGRKPVAVLISLQDFQERFVDQAADAERRKILAEIEELKSEAKDKTSSEDILRDLRAS